jgi:coenzyme F420-reducing hydrogenase delta subunit
MPVGRYRSGFYFSARYQERGKRRFGMTNTTGEGTILLYFCTRMHPADFAGFKAIMLPGEWVTIEVPCSGRVSVGDIMDALAQGYAKVAILSCGVASCIHEFGCIEAKKSMEKARELALKAGVDPARLVFIEADDPEIEAARRTGKKIESAG